MSFRACQRWRNAKRRPEFFQPPAVPNCGRSGMVGMATDTVRVSARLRNANPASSSGSRHRPTGTSSLPNAHTTTLPRALTSRVRHFVIPILGEGTMGRVYDALMRATGPPRDNTSQPQASGNSDNISYFVPNRRHEHPWERAAFTGLPSAFDSASTAHTAEATSGPALPAGPASRDAGATLGVVGSARAVEFSSREISTARVEPHLVAVTSPRSVECEQYRSLRTKIL